MAAISTHLHHKRYQLATSTNPSLPLRKWQHLGTKWDVSARQAALAVSTGAIVGVSHKDGGIAFQFSTGQFIRVGP